MTERMGSAREINVLRFVNTVLEPLLQDVTSGQPGFRSTATSLVDIGLNFLQAGVTAGYFDPETLAAWLQSQPLIPRNEGGYFPIDDSEATRLNSFTVDFSWAAHDDATEAYEAADTACQVVEYFLSEPELLHAIYALHGPDDRWWRAELRRAQATLRALHQVDRDDPAALQYVSALISSSSQIINIQFALNNFFGFAGDLLVGDFSRLCAVSWASLTTADSTEQFDDVYQDPEWGFGWTAAGFNLTPAQRRAARHLVTAAWPLTHFGVTPKADPKFAEQQRESIAELVAADNGRDDDDIWRIENVLGKLMAMIVALPARERLTASQILATDVLRLSGETNIEPQLVSTLSDTLDAGQWWDVVKATQISSADSASVTGVAAVPSSTIGAHQASQSNKEDPPKEQYLRLRI